MKFYVKYRRSNSNREDRKTIESPTVESVKTVPQRVKNLLINPHTLIKVKNSKLTEKLRICHANDGFTRKLTFKSIGIVFIIGSIRKKSSHFLEVIKRSETLDPCSHSTPRAPPSANAGTGPLRGDIQTKDPPAKSPDNNIS